jgi:hypothetical protein
MKKFGVYLWTTYHGKLMLVATIAIEADTYQLETGGTVVFYKDNCRTEMVSPFAYTVISKIGE